MAKIDELKDKYLEKVSGGGEISAPTDSPDQSLAAIIAALIGGKQCPYCNRWYAKNAIESHKKTCIANPNK